MEVMDEIKILDREDGFFTLLCRCGEEYSHQEAARIYARHDDERRGGERIDFYTGKSEKIPGDGNPSPRRQGLVVEFECEICGCDNELAIYQHKGNTFIGWLERDAEVDGDTTSGAG